MGEEWKDTEIPDEYLDAGRGRPPRALREARRPRRGPDGEVRRTRRSPRSRSSAARSAAATLASEGVPGALRLGVQEQGRPARARRDRRIPAEPARRAAASRATSPSRRTTASSASPTTRAVLGARVQDHVRPVRRAAHLPARLLRRAAQRLPRAELDEGPQGAHRARPADAREPPRGHGGGVHGRHRRRGRSQALDHRRHDLRPRQAGRARVDQLPDAGHLGRRRAEDQGRPGQARRRSGEALRRGPDVRRASSTTRPGRPSSRGWASCTSTSSSTASSASSTSTRTSGKPQVAYRETIRKEVHKVEAALRPADRRPRPVRPRRASTSSRRAPAAATSSSTRSSAARSRGSTSRRSTRASRRRSTTASSPATRWSTCARP